MRNTITRECSNCSIYSMIYPCGFLHYLFPSIMLPSYFDLQVLYFQNFSSVIFHFHTSYIPHFPLSWSFFRFLFSSILSSGFPTLFIPISFQLSSLSFGHHIRGQLFHSYFFCQMSLSQFSSLLDCFSAFSQFDATFFTHAMHTNCLNFLVVCFFFAYFLVSILPHHCLRMFVPSLYTRYSLQNVVFSRILL